MATVAASVVSLWILIGSFAGVAEHVDIGVSLGVFVDSWISRDAEKSKLSRLDIHRQSKEEFIVGFEDQFAFLVRKNLLTRIEEDV